MMHIQPQRRGHPARPVADIQRFGGREYETAGPLLKRYGYERTGSGPGHEVYTHPRGHEVRAWEGGTFTHRHSGDTSGVPKGKTLPARKDTFHSNAASLEKRLIQVHGSGTSGATQFNAKFGVNWCTGCGGYWEHSESCPQKGEPTPGQKKREKSGKCGKYVGLTYRGTQKYCVDKPGHKGKCTPSLFPDKSDKRGGKFSDPEPRLDPSNDPEYHWERHRHHAREEMRHYAMGKPKEGEQHAVKSHYHLQMYKKLAKERGGKFSDPEPRLDPPEERRPDNVSGACWRGDCSKCDWDAPGACQCANCEHGGKMAARDPDRRPNGVKPDHHEALLENGYKYMGHHDGGHHYSHQAKRETGRGGTAVHRNGVTTIKHDFVNVPKKAHASAEKLRSALFNLHMGGS